MTDPRRAALMVIAAAAWALSSCASAPVDTPDVAPLTAEQKAMCRSGGGCYTLTRAQLIKVIAEISEQLAAERCAEKT